MYQYRAILKSNQEIIAEGHTIEEVEHQVCAFRRQAKKGIHTRDNENVEIYKVLRNQKEGEHHSKEELIKII